MSPRKHLDELVAQAKVGASGMVRTSTLNIAMDLLRESEARLAEMQGQSHNTPQPPPTPGTGPAIWDLVIEDMRERDAIGSAKYGQRLQAGDGRESLVDAYQESLDKTVYLKKAIIDRDRERRESEVWERELVETLKKIYLACETFNGVPGGEIQGIVLGVLPMLATGAKDGKR